jgi:GDP-L-fucose synthase
VLLAAALAGGIQRNKTFPANLIQANLEIQCNVIGAAREAGVERLVFVASACCYPKHCSMPISTEALLTGPLEPTNEPFAVAKIAGIKMIEAMNRQHAAGYLSVIPPTLYGPGDHFDANGHVVAALIDRYHRARKEKLPQVEVWGTGTPRREFMYVDDAARAMLLLLEQPELEKDLYNIGLGQDIAISDLARSIAEVVGYPGQTRFDTSKPDGMPRRCLESKALSELGFRAETPLRQGLERTYQWYLDQEAR